MPASERTSTTAWSTLSFHAHNQPHLQRLLADHDRTSRTFAQTGDIILDYSRERLSLDARSALFSLARETQLPQKIESLFNGEHLNVSEDRAALHVALRAHSHDNVSHRGESVIPEVHSVLSRIKDFASKVRSGEIRGATGNTLTNVIAIGIGGSYLGPLFVHNAFETHPKMQAAASGRSLSFLANVDPEDVNRVLQGKDPERTLIVVISKTFTTAETMLNARTVRRWLVNTVGEEAVAQQMVAVSTATDKVAEFGINPEYAFGFWDWVGGRYSVTSAVGVLPLALQYGYDACQQFLDGARDIDQHFRHAPLENNVPALMGLIGVWNASFLGCHTNAVLPYCQALAKLPAHIQQLSMESNGKGVDLHGKPLPYDAGEIIFGEPGTNGQHSFYQLIHQGRTVPCEFIGVANGQQTVYLPGEAVSNHDELMSNFFAQPDALAYGKSEREVQQENGYSADPLAPHKSFSGNRPSLSLLLSKLDPYEVGQLLAIYEHKIVTQGFIWGINSFDQMGVELGKTLAKEMRGALSKARKEEQGASAVESLQTNQSTSRLLTSFFDMLSRHRGLNYSDAFHDPFEGFCLTGDECQVFLDEYQGPQDTE
jgi:glucose-6-phosphate isomerase